MPTRPAETAVPLAARRPLVPLLLGAALLAASVTAPSPAAAELRAVVSYDGAVPSLPGLDVLHVLPSVGALVVQGTPLELAGLPRVPGVRGVAPDTEVRFSGGASTAPAVAAAAGLAAPAGRPGAGSGVRVAVVDTGVTDSPALNRASGRLVDAVDTSTTANRGPLDDGYGHGTFMASVI